MTLETDRLYIKPLSVEDIQSVINFEIRNKQHFQKWASHSQTSSEDIDTYHQQMRTWIKEQKPVAFSSQIVYPDVHSGWMVLVKSVRAADS